MTEQTRPPRNAADRMLGKLLGRHHREMVISGENCVACHHHSPSAKEVRAALREQTRITVDEIRQRLDASSYYAKAPRGLLNAILDEVAALPRTPGEEERGG